MENIIIFEMACSSLLLLVQKMNVCMRCKYFKSFVKLFLQRKLAELLRRFSAPDKNSTNRKKCANMFLYIKFLSLRT